MKTVFISGAYTAKSRGEVMRNILAAHHLAATVLEIGACPICPHLNFAFMEEVVDVSYQQVLNTCFHLVTKCDAILMIKGWEKSSGASKERLWAKDLNLPIFYNPNQVKKWLRRENEHQNQNKK